MSTIPQLTEAVEFTPAMQFPVYDPANTQTRKVSGQQIVDGANVGALAVQATIDNRIYPGSYAADPTTRPDGSAVQAGDSYFNSSIARQKTYSGTVWGTDNLDAAALAASTGAGLVGWKQSGTGATSRTSQDKMREIVSVKDFGATGDGTTDDAAAIAAARVAAEANGWELVFPSGVYRVTIGFSFATPYKTAWRGLGDVTIKFDPATQNLILLNLTNATSHCTFTGIKFVPVTSGWGQAIRISGYPIVTTPNWKNTFTRCRFDNFKIGVEFTTDGSITDGTLMDFASESAFIHCKFKNCRTTVINRNQQAYNTSFYQTDMENDDVGEQYPLIVDETGCGINIHGGSLIGKGRLYTWKRPSGSTSIFSQSILNLTDCRVELRSPHIGQVFYQDPTGVYTGVNNVIINAVNLTILGFSQTLDLLYYAGRMKAKFVNLEVTSATLNVRNFPVAGVAAATTAGAQSQVQVTGNNSVLFVEDLTTTFGATDRRFPGAVSIQGGGLNNSGAFSTAADGFSSLISPPMEKLSYGLGAANVRRIVWNDPNETFGFKNVKAILPQGAKLLNLIVWKQPVRFASDIRFNLYLVKDAALWVTPGTFAVGTDTIATVASTGTTVNVAGFFSVPVKLLSNVLGNRMDAGYGTSWTEGRIYIEEDAAFSTAFFGGFVGVEYM